MNEKNKYRNRYEIQKEQCGEYDTQMEYKESADVKNGAWVMVTTEVPVIEFARPYLFGIYWGIPREDKFDRQICVIQTSEEVTLLNHEYTVISEEKLSEYRKQGWELRERAVPKRTINTEIIEKGRCLCEEEREIIWALQLDGLSEEQGCEEYFLTKHTDYNNSNICYIPHEDVYKQLGIM